MLDKTAEQLTVDQIAFLNHGPKGPVDAAIVELSYEGMLAADVANRCLKSGVGPAPKTRLLQQTILHATSSGNGKSILDIRRACGLAAQLRRDLARTIDYQAT